MNQIVDDLDSNKSKFEQQFQSDSKSDNKIGFRLNDDINFRLKSTNFLLKSPYF